VNWLLDTNTLSELTKPSPYAGLLDWLEANEAEAAISAISIGEMVAGIERMPEGKRRRSLERALKFLRADYAGRILDFTEGVAVGWGRLVAEARMHGRILSVVTRNGDDFYHPVFNPWEWAPSK